MRTLLLASFAAAIHAFPLRASARAGDPEPPPPNVLLIVLDDVGFEKLDWWPHQPFAVGSRGRPPTPAMAALASEGVMFTNYWTNPSCSPARAQILTGRNGHRTGIGEPIRPDTPGLHDDELLLPELIVAGNPAYRTGAFGKWHVAGAGDTCHPIDNGFEIFQGTMWNTTEHAVCSVNPGTWGEPGHHFWYEKLDSTTHSGCPTTQVPFSAPTGQPTGPYDPSMWDRWSSTETRLDALQWIASLDADDPFFAYVAFASPHEPLQVPPFTLLGPDTLSAIAARTDGMFQVGDRLQCASPPPNPCRECPTFVSTPCTSSGIPYHPLRVDYLNWMIESIDTEIQELMDGLEQLGRKQDTVVVVVSDNGTAQMQVDCSDAMMMPELPALNPRHAKLWPYQLGARVPLFVWGPRVVPQAVRGSECTQLVSAVDLWRTIAEITGMTQAQVDAIYLQQPPPPGNQATWTLDSHSFFGRIQDPATVPPLGRRREFALVEWFEGLDPYWELPPARFRRAIIHESGFKYGRIAPVAPAGNLTEEILHLPSDPAELFSVAEFSGYSGGNAACLAGPCPPSPPCPPGPPCPQLPCPFGGMNLVGCTLWQDPSCQYRFFRQMFEQMYAPYYCVDLTTN